MGVFNRRAVLGAAAGLLVGTPFPCVANSIEPILRSPSGMVADLLVTTSDPAAEQVRTSLNDVLSGKVFELLRDEAQRAKLAIPVYKMAVELQEAPDLHSILYIRTRLDIRTQLAADLPIVIGAAGMKFQRAGYEALQSAGPLSLFIAARKDLVSKATAAIREQFAMLVIGMQKAEQ